jgi:hypothetical protein
MNDLLTNNQEMIASILALAILMLMGMAVQIMRSLRWNKAEEAIRALAPDQYESILVRITKTVFDSIHAESMDITDDQVKKHAAQLSLKLIQLIAKRNLTADNIEALLDLYRQRGIAVGVIGDDTKTDIDRAFRLISNDLASTITRHPPDV